MNFVELRKTHEKTRLHISMHNLTKDEKEQIETYFREHPGQKRAYQYKKWILAGIEQDNKLQD